MRETLVPRKALPEELLENTTLMYPTRDEIEMAKLEPEKFSLIGKPGKEIGIYRNKISNLEINK